MRNLFNEERKWQTDFHFIPSTNLNTGFSWFFWLLLFVVLNEFAWNENEREKDKCPNEKNSMVVRIVNENLWLSFITTFFYVYISDAKSDYVFHICWCFFLIHSFIYEISLFSLQFRSNSVSVFLALSHSSRWERYSFFIAVFYTISASLSRLTLPWNSDAENAFRFYNALKKATLLVHHSPAFIKMFNVHIGGASHAQYNYLVAKS